VNKPACPYSHPTENAACWLNEGHRGQHEGQKIPTAKVVKWCTHQRTFEVVAFEGTTVTCSDCKLTWDA
jgi:hypothetical protein